MLFTVAYNLRRSDLVMMTVLCRSRDTRAVMSVCICSNATVTSLPGAAEILR